MESVFSSLVEEIEAAYDRLGHKHGWRLLYTPKRTLSPETRLATVGINPGGGNWQPPRPSVEAGSAYRTETWPDNGPALQAQIQLLYRELARKVGAPSPEQLMDETLAANFYPFRSAREGRLENEAASREFSRQLWRTILRHVNPRVWICFGGTPAQELQRLLPATGWRRIETTGAMRVGWAGWTYELARYDSPRGRTLLVRLPHLSYAVFGRPPSQAAFKCITSAIAAAMTDDDWSLPPGAGPDNARTAVQRRHDSPAVPTPRISSSRSRAGELAGRGSGGIGRRATSLLGQGSYNISDARAHRFLEMLDALPGLRAALDARDLTELRAMVSPGGRVAPDLSARFSSPIAGHATAIGYQQVNWLRGAIAVYVARRSQSEDS